MIKKNLHVWQTISRRTLLQHSKFLTVESHTVRLPDGRIIDDWPWLIIPSAVIVLPVTDENQFLCFRQTKYALQGTSLAPVGGMLEPDEAPLAAAQRELLEELGCLADEWIALGSPVLEPNRGMATSHLYLALHARKVAEPHSDDLEDQEILSLSRLEIESALQAGEFKVLAWVATVALALNYLRS
jgi:ADP-ribose pyrophosphatase